MTDHDPHDARPAAGDDLDEEVPGHQGGLTPEHHGGVGSGREAVGDYVEPDEPEG